jgi:hypothetical protein
LVDCTNSGKDVHRFLEAAKISRNEVTEEMFSETAISIYSESVGI